MGPENEKQKLGLTSIMGICDMSCPLSSLIMAQIGRSSSRLCREHTEYTRMKAWPLLMESRCIAGNWWDPVVSVIWSVHMFLLQLITWNIASHNRPYFARSMSVSDRRRARFSSRHTARVSTVSPAKRRRFNFLSVIRPTRRSRTVIAHHDRSGEQFKFAQFE